MRGQVGEGERLAELPELLGAEAGFRQRVEIGLILRVEVPP